MGDDPKVREAFEACALLRWHPDASAFGAADLKRDDCDGYYNTAIEYAWRIWLASRRAALEEAAMVCEERKGLHDSGLKSCGSVKEWSDFDLQEEVSLEAKCCAWDIRALLEKDAPPPPSAGGVR